MAGRTTARRSREGRQHSDSPVNYWHRPLKSVPFGRFEFRATVERGKESSLRLDRTIETLNWSESGQGVLTGSMTVHRPTRGPRLIVGDKVRIAYTPWGQNRWQTLFIARLAKPEFSIGDDQYQYTLEDDLLRASRSKITVKLRQDRAHPNGWRADAAIREVCRRADIPVGRLPRMKYRVKRGTWINQSPTVILANLLKHERRKTGSRYFYRWVGGRLSVVPFQRSKDLLIVGGFLQSGSYSESLPSEFATVLEAWATADDGSGKDTRGRRRHKKRKLRTRVESKNGIAKHGRIIKTVQAPSADSVAELRKWAKRELARRGHVKQTLTFTHPGLPTLRRGDALRVTVKRADLDKVIVFVSEIAHSVSAGSYTMDVTVDFEDPYIDASASKAAKKKRAVTRKRGRVDPKSKTPKPVPKKRSQRSDT